MGWVWKDDDDERSSGAVNRSDDRNPRSENRCYTRKILNSQCKTEEVEPGKFVRKCEKTEQLLKECAGRPSEVVQSNKEYTEEDVTEEVMNGTLSSESSDLGAFGFPGLRNDIEAIERSISDSMSRFFEVAEDVKNDLFGVFGAPQSPPRARRNVPIEGNPRANEVSNQVNKQNGHVDISGLARDI